MMNRKDIVTEATTNAGGGSENWEDSSVLNETRYTKLIEKSIFPPWTLLRESFREDPKLLLPRMIMTSIRTVKRIPGCVLMQPGKMRTGYIFGVLRHWAKKCCRVGQVRLDVQGLEKVDPSRTYLFVVNHMSPADIPVIYATIPLRAGFVANALFLRIPIFSYWMRMSGAVFIDQGNHEEEFSAFKLMIKRLKRGRSLILFPEGYIYQGEGLAEFKRGGLNAAVLAGVPIVPLCLYGTQNVMQAGSLHIKPRRRVAVEFGEPIETKNLSREERKGIDSFVYERLKTMKLNLADEWARRGSHW
jgi:1-acyl-sn-glycerol-3-phosphate acyltransferase